MCPGKKPIDVMPDPKKNLMNALAVFYKHKVLPLENFINYEPYGGPPIDESEFLCQVRLFHSIHQNVLHHQVKQVYCLYLFTGLCSTHWAIFCGKNNVHPIFTRRVCARLANRSRADHRCFHFR